MTEERQVGGSKVFACLSDPKSMSGHRSPGEGPLCRVSEEGAQSLGSPLGSFYEMPFFQVMASPPAGESIRRDTDEKTADNIRAGATQTSPSS